VFAPAPLSTFLIGATSGLPLALATDATGSFLYAGVANLGLVGYAVDSGSGALSALPGPPVIGPPIAPSAVLAADAAAGFPYLYFQERVFGIAPILGVLVESPESPLAVAGGVTGIAAASPVDQLPDDPVNPITGPVTSLSPPSLQFGEQLLGTTSAPQPVALANTGAAPLMWSGIELTGTNAADFVLWHDCPAEFLSAAKKGLVSGRIVLHSPDPGLLIKEIKPDACIGRTKVAARSKKMDSSPSSTSLRFSRDKSLGTSKKLSNTRSQQKRTFPKPKGKSR